MLLKCHLSAEVGAEAGPVRVAQVSHSLDEVLQPEGNKVISHHVTHVLIQGGVTKLMSHEIGYISYFKF